MKRRIVVLAAPLVLMALASARPAQATEVDEKTKAQVVQAIKAYIEGDLELKKKFLILDPRTGEPLALAYDHVHAGVHPHAQGLRACVDFADASGTVYDVDVVVALGQEAPQVREVFVHKVAGEAVKAPGN